jgi:hypothetical protein
MGEEILDRFVALVEELDEDHDAIIRDVGGVAELLDLAFGQRTVAALRVKGHSESEKKNGEREPTEH